MSQVRRMLSCKACLWILVVACLLSSGRMLVHSLRSSEDAAENQRRSGQRFAELREVLPKRGVIGYMGQSQDSWGTITWRNTLWRRSSWIFPEPSHGRREFSHDSATELAREFEAPAGLRQWSFAAGQRGRKIDGNRPGRNSLLRDRIPDSGARPCALRSRSTLLLRISLSAGFGLAVFSIIYFLARWSGFLHLWAIDGASARSCSSQCVAA